MKNFLNHRFFTLILLGGSPLVGLGQSTWDFSADPDQNWSTFTNWDTDLTPASTAVFFNDTAGATADATTVGNIVDTSFTIDSLSYQNTGSTWQVTQIASGRTLTLNAAVAPGVSLSVGAAAGTTTQAAITGPGSLVINQSTAPITVSTAGVNGGSAGSATLDMSGLASFNATVSAVNVGTGTLGNGTLYLAQNSTITATTLLSGGSINNTSGDPSNTNHIYFGQTTVLNIDSIQISKGHTGGGASFQSGLSGATLTVRASDGTSRATLLSVGDYAGAADSKNAGSASSSLDLTGGSVDVLVTTLTVGQVTSSTGRVQHGQNHSLLMNSGIIDATTVNIARSTSTYSSSSSTLTGTVDISGGTFNAGTISVGSNTGTTTINMAGNLNVSGTASVNVSGDVVAGTVSSAGTVTSNINISGGTLTVGGSLAEGAGGASVTSTVNLSAGTLDMTNGAVAVDTFDFTGGTLKNVASFTGDLNAQNGATLGFDNVDGAFVATSLAGALTLGASSNLSLALADGFTPVTGFTLVDNDGADSISGTFLTVNGGSFGLGNTFSLTNNTGTYDFSLSYAGGDGNDLSLQLVTAAVPEPSACALLAGLLALGLVAGTRHRRRM